MTSASTYPIDRQLRDLARLFPNAQEWAVSQEMFDAYVQDVVRMTRFITRRPGGHIDYASLTFNGRPLTVWPPRTAVGLASNVKG